MAVPWKESNLALIDSELDHKIKQAAADGEPQWDRLGEAPGTLAWRVEDFQVKPVNMQEGRFYQGDSYVVLHSRPKDNNPDSLQHDLHIWIGMNSSQDEYGTAAYKMVEADELLGGAAVQHREVQGHESALFRSYFDHDLVYLQGGVASGFHHVETQPDEPHLYMVKGTGKGLSLRQVPLQRSSLNEGDSFVLFVNASMVYVWHGAEANPHEKARAVACGEKMCTEGTAVILDQGDNDSDESFWNVIGTHGDIHPADDADDAVEEFAPLLFRLSSDPDEEPEQVAKGELVKIGFHQEAPRLQKNMLDDSDVFLLDAGWELFVYIGNTADRGEKRAALGKADRYAQEDPRTSDLPLTIVKAGFANADFDQYFVD